jgi:hypothetical protein
MDEDEKKLALERIAAKVKEAEDAIKAAEQIADEHQVSFSFTPAYGMGGSYYPKKVEGVERENNWWGSDEGWVSSSRNC